MLDKKDLKNLERLLDSRTKLQIDPLEKKIRALSESVDDLKTELKSESTRIQSEFNVSLLRARQDMKLEFKPINRHLAKISKDMETIVSFFDKEIMDINQRVARIEEVLNLKPRSPIS